MSKSKQEKNDVLVSVIDMMYDMNKNVVLETIEGNKHNDNPRIPGTLGKKHICCSDVLSYAQSIKIGNISIKRIQNGKKRAYIVRTPSKEVEFSDADSDFKQVWKAVLRRYCVENGSNDRFYEQIFLVIKTLYKKVDSQKLKDAASCGITTKKDRISKYEVAIHQLQQIGVKPNLLATYIQNKTR